MYVGNSSISHSPSVPPFFLSFFLSFSHLSTTSPFYPLLHLPIQSLTSAVWRSQSTCYRASGPGRRPSVLLSSHACLSSCLSHHARTDTCIWCNATKQAASISNENSIKGNLFTFKLVYWTCIQKCIIKLVFLLLFKRPDGPIVKRTFSNSSIPLGESHFINSCSVVVYTACMYTTFHRLSNFSKGYLPS